MKLGYEKEVQHTLRYALHRFKKHGRVTTTITPRGRPYEFPKMGVDSLPWFIHSLKVSKFPYYDHRFFLNKEIKQFFSEVIDANTGLVHPDRHFSSMKDYALRKSSCYDNCLVALLAEDLKKMKLDNPFSAYDYESLIVRHFWNGHYFYDDLSKQDYVAGDANVFPFVLGIVKDKDKLTSALIEIRGAELEQPFPLRYTQKRNYARWIWQEKIMPNYESNSIWTHMGPLFIKLIKQDDAELAAEYKRKYTEWIEKEGNYLEVFTANGKPYRNWYYRCDQGMLWAANYLTL